MTQTHNPEAAKVFAFTNCLCALFGVSDRDEATLIGTAVPIEVAGNRFLLTAAHVLDNNSLSALYVQIEGELSALLATEACKTPLPPSGSREDDKVDVACIRLDEPFRNSLARVMFVDPKLIDVNHIARTDHRYTFMGYPSSKNRFMLKKRPLRLTAWSYTSRSALTQDYGQLGISTATHICVPFDKERVLDESNQVITAPDMYGMSGGPVWFHSTDGLFKLAAIGTDHKRRSCKVLIGTGIAVFAAALAKQWPNLKDSLPPIRNAKINVECVSVP